MADSYNDYSREELIRELRLRDRRPRFGLVWERKEIEHEKAVNDDFIALEFDPDLSCGDAPYRNLIIEGDSRSRLNVYGLLPQDLNDTERRFAETLDADITGTVTWWHRNEPRKPWSVGIIMPSGDRYYPDFIVGVNGRHHRDGMLLVEIKGNHIINYEDTWEKINAEHKQYGKPLMLTRQDDGRFWIMRYIDSARKIEQDQVFRVENIGHY